jgi:hypothetical protein
MLKEMLSGMRLIVCAWVRDCVRCDWCASSVLTGYAGLRSGAAPGPLARWAVPACCCAPWNHAAVWRAAFFTAVDACLAMINPPACRQRI